MDELGKMWAEIPSAETMRVETGSGSIRRLGQLTQLLVSGDLAAAAAKAGVDPAGVGALGSASGDSYSVRIARDRLLIVSADDLLLAPGWNDGGYAVTNMTALAVFEIDGVLADEIVARATTLPISAVGPSAAVIFAGVGAYLYRHEARATLCVHVDPSHAAYIWNWLNALLPGIRV